MTVFVLCDLDLYTCPYGRVVSSEDTVSNINNTVKINAFITSLSLRQRNGVTVQNIRMNAIFLNFLTTIVRNNILLSLSLL